MKKYRVLWMVFLLAGCISTPNLWGGTPAPILASETSVPSPTSIFTPLVTPLPPVMVEPMQAAPDPAETLATGGIQRVLIISYDGLRPDAIAAAPMNNLLALIESGAYSFTAKTIPYPATLPSHASMLSGLCMEKHGVIYNKYFIYMGYSKGVDLFDLAHAAGMRTVMVVSKDKLRQLAEPETTDVFEVRYGESAVAEAAVEQISAGFGLMFVHFAGADLRGHKYGWMSDPQFKVLREGDDALGKILTALDQAGLRQTTLIVVTADHGGHDRNHIGLVIEDYHIPWIISGPGIIPGELKTVIQTMDTAVTAAYALKFPSQPEWDGIPVYEAFGLPLQNAHGDAVCK